MRSRVVGTIRWVKYLMFFFNVLFWLTGVALVVIGGLGELLYGDYKNITQTGFTSATAILIGVGCAIGVLGFAGCYGAIRENYYTLKVFSYLLTLLLITEIALGLWLYFAHFSLAKFVKGFLDNILSKYEEDKDIEDLIDKIQREYHCCGSTSYKDWFNSEWNEQRQQRSAILLSFQHDASAELRKRFGHSYQTSREVCPYRRLSASQGVLLEAYFVYDFSWGGRDGVTRSRHIVYVLSAPRDQTFASVAAF